MKKWINNLLKKIFAKSKIKKLSLLMLIIAIVMIVCSYFLKGCGL